MKLWWWKWHRVVALAAAVALLAGACGGDEGAEESGPIKIGVLTELSGVAGAYGPPVVNAAKLAIDQINEEGGVLGRQLALEIGDDATDVKTSAVQAERLISKENVAVLLNMTSSANREANIPIVERTGALYIYVPLYEGESCLENMFLLGEVPEQYAPAFPYIQDTLGGDAWYFLGNDYNWPQITNAKAKETIESAGGQVVGEDLVPFATSEYAEILDKIASSGANHILLTLVGTDIEVFIKQWRAFGLDTSTNAIALALGDNQLPSLGADAEGVYGLYGYFNGLDTEVNQQYIADYVATFGEAAPAQTTLSEAMYNGVRLWALAAEKAGTTDPDAVRDTMEGITFEDAPRGPITVDPETHHVAQHMYLVQAGSDAKYHLVEDFGLIDPGPQCSF